MDDIQICGMSVGEALNEFLRLDEMLKTNYKDGVNKKPEMGDSQLIKYHDLSKALQVLSLNDVAGHIQLTWDLEGKIEEANEREQELEEKISELKRDLEESRWEYQVLKERLPSPYKEILEALKEVCTPNAHETISSRLKEYFNSKKPT